jgi:quinoprotein glucose dehydrogenase
LWIFHTIPRPGEFGYDTWQRGSEEYTGNTGVWAQMSADEELGLLYLPVEMPTGDYYGGHRPGAGLFGESLVALDVKTGKRKWHYQFIKHGIWDWDLPCAGILGDVTIDGRMRKIIMQPTKQGWLYVFDRVDRRADLAARRAQGRGVGRARGDAQPRRSSSSPNRRRTSARVSSPDDLIDFTPALKAEGLKLASRFKLGPIFTPPVVSKWDGPLATLDAAERDRRSQLAGRLLRSREPGSSTSSPTPASPTSGLVPGGQQSDMAYVRGQASNPQNAKAPPVTLTVQGLPLVKPPTGVSPPSTSRPGTMAWQIAHGETPDNIRNHPALKGVTIPRTGPAGAHRHAGDEDAAHCRRRRPVITLPDGRRGAMLRAYDKATGKDAGAVYMPAPQSGSPMTYLLDGRQYIVVAISGPGFPES